jgi:hypothetical protein
MMAAMITILTDRTSHETESARVAADGLWLPGRETEAATGWTLKPEGFCREGVCVPVPVPLARRAEFVQGDEVNVAALWRQLGAPVVHDATRQTWMLGTSAEARSSRLQSLDAPDFTLPDLDGRLHSLRDQYGKKVLLVSWASW